MKKSSGKKDEKKNGKRDNNKDDTLSVVSLLLEETKDEYGKERERANSLDNKINIFISVMFAVITLYVPEIPFDEIKAVYVGANKMKIVFVTVCVIVSLLSFHQFVCAFYKLFKAISVRAYMRVNINALNDDVVFSKSDYNVTRGLLDHYDTILENNARINDDKAAKLTEGIKYCITGFALLSVATLGLWIVV